MPEATARLTAEFVADSERNHQIDLVNRMRTWFTPLAGLTLPTD
jgi:hypothetical protein